MSDTFHPAPALLCKLGSIIVHAQECLSSDWHPFDRAALEALLADPEVREWLQEMDKASLLPKMRKSRKGS
jgi:hypothetical protein